VLAIELETRKIRVNALNPGMVETEGVHSGGFVGSEIEKQLVGQTPLGRILINHDVMRRIEPTGFLRMVPGPELMKHFGLSEPMPTYGRLAYIHCNEQPAIELLEVVAPEETSP